MERSTDVLFVWLLYELKPVGQGQFQRPSLMSGLDVGIGSITNFSWNHRSERLGSTLTLDKEKDNYSYGRNPTVGLKLSPLMHLENHQPYEDITVRDIESVGKWHTTQGKLLGGTGKEQEKGLVDGISLYEFTIGVKIRFQCTTTYESAEFR